jgi:YkoY family integral membrane protein
MFQFLTFAADVDLGFWGQTYNNKDLMVILLLVLLEGVLSIDNALVLGLLAKRVPKPLQKRALTYGLIGAFVFRILAIATASYLLKWRIVKLLGGGYLIYIAVKHLFFESKEDAEEVVTLDKDGEPELRIAETGLPLTLDQEMTEIKERVPVPIPEQEMRAGKSFWMAVAVIELTDIAFAVDSILAAIALVGSPPADHPVGATHPKLWVVIAGGMLGVMLMRVAAAMFIRLLEKFPRFEVSAYLLVIVIGLKLLVDWGFNSEAHPHTIDFHSFRTPEFWIFWISMLACLAYGFMPKKSGHVDQQKS